jgi:hypothetical protein
VAQYAAKAGRHDLAESAIESTLFDARAMIGELVADLPPDTLTPPVACGPRARGGPAERFLTRRPPPP